MRTAKIGPDLRLHFPHTQHKAPPLACKMGAIFSSVARVSPEKLEKVVLGSDRSKAVSIG